MQYLWERLGVILSELKELNEPTATRTTGSMKNSLFASSFEVLCSTYSLIPKIDPRKMEAADDAELNSLQLQLLAIKMLKALFDTKSPIPAYC